MSSNEKYFLLIEKLERLVKLLNMLSQSGVQPAKVIRVSIHRHLNELKELLKDPNNQLKTIILLLDIVPNSKDIDGIGFNSESYSEVSQLLSEISIEGARIAAELLAEQ